MGESIPRPKASEVSPARAAHSATAPTRSELQISRSLSSWSKPPTSTISSVTQRNAENREPASAGTTRTPVMRSEQHTSELQSLMRISYAAYRPHNKNHKDNHH